MPPPPSEQTLSELLARKEEEWRALQAQHSQLQEAALHEARGQLEEAQRRLRCLQEDFLYNLQVLEERDRELERYDAAFAQARRLEEARQAEVSELKVEAARLRQALAREAQQLEDLQQQQQRKEQEHRLALQRVHSDKNGEMDQQREQYEKLKWTLERRLEELDGQRALQRQELLLEFESETKRREQAFQLHVDSMSGVVLEHELKAKLLNEELGALREAGAQAAESLQSAQATNSELEDRLQRAAWELRDLATVKDARIKELEDKLQSAQLTRKKEEEMFRRKHEELDRTARERDAVLASVKDAHAEQLRALEARVLELQAQCEALEVQARRAEWRQADALKEKDAAIAQLREEASTLRSSWDAQVAQMSKEMTSRDLRVQSLQQEEAELQAQLARCQQDVSRYQRQLSLATEREQSLEREKAQLGLDWQRRCASLERDHYRQSEELIQGLTTAREQVAAKLQEAERKLHEQEVVLKAMTLERDQALQALRTHGLLPEQELEVLLRRQGEEVSTGFLSGEIQRLQEQNSSLRDAVARMRTEMEALSKQVLPPTLQAGDRDAARAPQPAAQATTPDYVLALEAEIQNLKGKFKMLEEQLGDVPGPPRAPLSQREALPSVPPTAEATEDTASHDSVSMGLALRRLGDRTRLLNLLVTRLRPKVLAAGGPLGTEDPGAQAPSVQQLQRKLKEAAQTALRLQLEKEQLLELGNRLRAKLGRPAGGKKSRSAAHTEPTLSLTLSPGKPCRPRPSPEAWIPGEGPEKPSEQGPPLKQLQPHLTSQDLKRTDEGRPGETPPHAAPAVSRNDASRGTAAGTVGPGQKQHRISTVTGKSTRQKENRSPEPGQAHGLLQGSGHPTQRSSSLASSSLQDTWKLLDLGSSPSGLASQDDSTPAELTAPAAANSPQHTDGSPAETRAPFAIKGVKMEAQAKAKPARAHPANPKRCQRAPKIRNYNFKD
ncbi:coiled-coil domain-containing protein 57 isoform X3 [Sturnira hondurensis]|uniref:coiled-coil domain-containing protein 57 isoform X3 n=1 Tax=Sturnira hondurensis TaxID=192404 RepID=UPI00187AF7E6|nr:coiled-coil domain-containing protein 57 isoform X3 [Sturnira hondurensis]